MKHPKGFASKLARLRAQADMTQKDLAKASGISVPQIGRYETGLSKPRMNALIKLANALRVDVSELEDSASEPAVISITLDEEGMRYPATISQDLYEAVENVAQRLGISVNASLILGIDVLKARAEGKEIDFGETLHRALEYLGEDPPAYIPKKD